MTAEVDLTVGGNEDAVSGGLSMVRGKGELSGRVKLSLAEMALRCGYHHR
jgi:hypothetical protein